MTLDITVHMVVKNEEQWIWYGLQSVLPYVKKIIIYDTGSSDKTVEIIETFSDSKIYLEKRGDVNPKQLAQLRNEQIEQTSTEWFLLLDGDEVWPENTLRELEEVIKTSSKKTHGIVVKARIPVGDLFHYQSEIAGKYKLLGQVGHYNMRIYRKNPKYHWEAIYPFTVYVEKYVDNQGISVQDRSDELFLLKKEYWHMTHLKRSSIDSHGKRKFEIGIRTAVELPTVFYKKHPPSVPDPWVHYSFLEWCFAFCLTPLLYFKRRL